MPAGVVKVPDGPQDQQKLGQILCTNGDVIPFFNTKNLEKGEPVIFDIIRTKLQIKAEIDGVKYNYAAKMPVGILPLDFEVKESEKKWPLKLQERWKKEWSEFNDDSEIKKILGSVRTSIKRHHHCD